MLGLGESMRNHENHFLATHGLESTGSYENHQHLEDVNGWGGESPNIQRVDLGSV